jgi:hypothetical protein
LHIAQPNNFNQSVYLLNLINLEESMEINNTKIVVKNLDLAARKNLYELWKKTPGLSKNSFCKQQGIASTTFHQWCKKFSNNKIKSKKHKSNWIPINLPKQNNKQENPSKIIALELLLPNNIKATVNTSINEAVNLIQELCYAATVIR